MFPGGGVVVDIVVIGVVLLFGGGTVKVGVSRVGVQQRWRCLFETEESLVRRWVGLLRVVVVVVSPSLLAGVDERFLVLLRDGRHGCRLPGPKLFKVIRQSKSVKKTMPSVNPVSRQAMKTGGKCSKCEMQRWR